MVDPNRKINRLTDRDIEFLDECEEDFKDRYTDIDKEFVRHCQKTEVLPPCLDPWEGQNRNNYQDKHRGGGGNFRHHNRGGGRGYYQNNYRGGGGGGGGGRGSGGGGYNRRGNFNNPYNSYDKRQNYNSARPPMEPSHDQRTNSY